MADDLHLRPAADADAELVLAWANDPVTREASFSTQVISSSEHLAWFATQRARTDRNPLIAEHDGEPVAFVRLDAKADAPRVCTISINVAPAARGQGLGRRSLEAATREAARLGFDEIQAVIRPENAASRRAFTRAGYVLAGETDVCGQPAQILTRKVLATRPPPPLASS